MLRHELQQHIKRTRAHLGIWIDQPDMARPQPPAKRGADAQVVAGGESAVDRRCDQLDPRAPTGAVDRRAQLGHRTIARIVVDHYDARVGVRRQLDRQ